jgi:hypothetical protein
MHNEEKGCKSSLVIIVMLLVLVPVGLNRLSAVAPEVQAQSSSSCDRDVGSLVDCSPSTSSSRSSEDSSVTDDSDEKDSNNDDNDNGGNNEEEKEEKESGDIESKIPSTAGVPFP